MRCPRCTCAFIIEACCTHGYMIISEDQFKRYHSERRKYLKEEKLKNQNEKTRKYICQIMEKEFRDLGIQI